MDVNNTDFDEILCMSCQASKDCTTNYNDSITFFSLATLQLLELPSSSRVRSSFSLRSRGVTLIQHF